MAVRILDAEAGRRTTRLAERLEPRLLRLAARTLQGSTRAADAEGDVVEAGRSGGKGIRLDARHLERDVVVMEAGGEEDDAPVLAAPRPAVLL